MADLGGRYAAYTARLVDGVLASPGHTPGELRRAVLARAYGPHPLSPSPFGRGGTTPETSFPLSGTERGSGGEDLLAAYVDKVARHAYRVTDEDLGRLQQAGHSDDALFEVTVSAALGAALGRLERGLAALRGEPRSVSDRGEEPVSSPPDPLSTTWSSPPVPLSATRRGGTQE